MQYPKHIALIPDGNRTWAKEHWMNSFLWHLEWFNRVVELAKHIFSATPIQVFTAWWLSTENLKNRSEQELTYLFELYKKVTEDLYELLEKEKINFRVAGDIDQLPDNLRDFLLEKQKKFSFWSERTLVLAVNYGGQDELLRAIKKLQNSWKEITQENLEEYMDFWGLPKVELLIRTKQKLAKRLSGFMLWWIWYAQLYFTDIYCPDFDISEFQKALEWYDKTVSTQNFGK